jgi:hypothetical protein
MSKFSKKIKQFQCPKNYPISGVLPPVERIIVIGDVHGDMKRFKDHLKLAKLIDNEDNWIGGETVLVQLGDLIDSCRGSDCLVKSSNDQGADLELLKYMVELHNKAIKHNGAVYSIIGNHEIMNVLGKFDYVSPKNFDKVIDLFNDKSIDKYKARIEAFKPGNPIASFLACSKFGVLIIGSNLFVHAGMMPEISKDYTPQDINKIIKNFLLNKIKDPTEYEKILFSAQYSPFWTRVMGHLSTNLPKNSKECEKFVNPVLNYYKIGKIFIGHSPTLIQNLGINSTCDESVYRVDTGFAQTFDKYRKTPYILQVLEILNDNEINIIV